MPSFFHFTILPSLSESFQSRLARNCVQVSSETFDLRHHLVAGCFKDVSIIPCPNIKNSLWFRETFV